ECAVEAPGWPSSKSSSMPATVSGSPWRSLLGSPAVGEQRRLFVGVASDAYVALDREGGVGVAELVGDDGGVEVEVEEHPAGGDVAEVVDGPAGGAGPAPALVVLAVA